MMKIRDALLASNTKPRSIRHLGVVYTLIKYPWEEYAYPRCNLGHWTEKPLEEVYLDDDTFMPVQENL